MAEKIRSISGVLEDLSNNLGEAPVSMAFIRESFHERGFGFLLILFALPMALPMPVPPGINLIFGVPILLLTAQQAMGRHTIWMPKSMLALSLPAPKIKFLIQGILPFLRWLEYISKPRLGFMTQGACSHVIGFLGFLMALFICIPLPLTNTVPSLGIVLMSLGVIMRDGVAVIAGAIIGICWMWFLTFTVLLVGGEGVELIQGFFNAEGAAHE
jgi:hypothetical protein